MDRGGKPSEDTVSTEGLAKYVSDKEDIKIANYKDRTGIKSGLKTVRGVYDEDSVIPELLYM